MMTDDDFEQLDLEPIEKPTTQEKAVTQSSGPSLKARAIDFLSRREHSRSELHRKLQRHSDDLEAINQLLDQLEQDNWLSNERFAHSLLNRRQHKFGSRRLLYELRQHGVDEEQLQHAQEQLQATEYERAFDVWQRKFGSKPIDQKAWAKQHRFMASRGFSPDLLRRILERVDDTC